MLISNAVINQLSLLYFANYICISALFIININLFYFILILPIQFFSLGSLVGDVIVRFILWYLVFNFLAWYLDFFWLLIFLFSLTTYILNGCHARYSIQHCYHISHINALAIP